MALDDGGVNFRQLLSVIIKAEVLQNSISIPLDGFLLCSNVEAVGMN